MAINIIDGKPNKLLFCGLLLMVLIIGGKGPLLQTLDNDENLGITFLEVSIGGHAEVGSFAHLAPVVRLVGFQFFHPDLHVEHIVRGLKSSPFENIALTSFAIPLRL
jgi:hypothetical protein